VHDLEAVFVRHGRVEELALDDVLYGHLVERGTYAKHDVTLAEILQVHQGQPRYFTNAGSDGRRAPVIMVGPTQAGRWLCVPIEPAGGQGVWRAVTGFEANTHHKVKYERQP
jgi:hypothetical protein